MDRRESFGSCGLRREDVDGVNIDKLSYVHSDVTIMLVGGCEVWGRVGEGGRNMRRRRNKSRVVKEVR